MCLNETALQVSYPSEHRGKNSILWNIDYYIYICRWTDNGRVEVYQFDYRTWFIDYIYKVKFNTIINIPMRNTAEIEGI